MPRVSLDWIQLVTLLGAVQGVFLAGVLATRKHGRTAHRLLAALMLAFSIQLASSVYLAAGLVPLAPHFLGASFPLPLLFGPLLYLYALSAADRSRRLSRRDALHFLPSLTAMLAGLPVYLTGGAAKVAFYHQLQLGYQPLLFRIVVPAQLVSGLSYTVLTILFLKRHSAQVKDSYSSLERVNLEWLLWLGGAGVVVWGMVFTFFLLSHARLSRPENGDALIGLAIAVVVYAIGYKGLRQPEIFRFDTAELPVPRLALAAPEPEAPRYERSGLTGRDAERLEAALTSLMDAERPWQDSSLTLADLAARLSTTPHRLSEVLNAQVGQSFYDFVNGYRVREVQRRIAAGEARSRTILSLALEAGFASKSAFNLVFKKHTSQTPSDYRQAAEA